MMRIVGLDLSWTGTGIASPEGTACIRTKPTLKAGERLAQIRDGVAHAVAAADLVVMEGYSFGSPFRAAQAGELGGVVKLLLWELKLEVAVVPPSTLKKFATGRGQAKKPEVVAQARERLGYDGFEDNEADALWLRAFGHELRGQPLVRLPKDHLAAVAAHQKLAEKRQKKAAR